jgi:hypothetical protein
MEKVDSRHRPTVQNLFSTFTCKKSHVRKRLYTPTYAHARGREGLYVAEFRLLIPNELVNLRSLALHASPRSSALLELRLYSIFFALAALHAPETPRST